MTASVEELASSLVREFLSRKGLKLTLARMDEELPRTSGSISNRAMLARALHIEKLMKKNKDGGNHLQAMIEVITKYLLDKSLSSAVSQHSSSCTMHVPPQLKPSLGGVATTSVTAMTSCYTGPKTGASVREGGDISGRRRQRLRGSAIGDNPPIMAEITPGRASTAAMTMAGRETEQPQLLWGETGTKGTTSMRRGMESRQYDLNPRSMAEWESDQKQSGRKSHSNSMQGDMQCEDLEEVDFNLDDHGTHHTDTGTGKGHHHRIVGQPISLEKAKMLRKLLFGSANGPSFNSEWRRQNFTFCDLPRLEYGLVQHKGGPCGMLACIQAYILKHLLLKHSKSVPDCLQPSPEERTAALVSALADILWKVGGPQNRAVVALPAAAPSQFHSARLQSHSYTPDHITEQVILHNISEEAILREFLASHVATFQRASDSGCIHFLLSVLLSKGIESIRKEMDNEESTLIGTHSYCTQEMVNLLLTGKAVSNVFDGNINLDSGSSHKNLLKGISERSEIGFLSLFEHYGNCIVGSHYKDPVYPIWVVCSESHFTVLFSSKRHLPTDRHLERKFDLIYFDGLANQDEEIRLTLNNAECKEDENKSRETNSELVSPLELCIRTKWKRATVNWNNTEPLL